MNQSQIEFNTRALLQQVYTTSLHQLNSPPSTTLPPTSQFASEEEKVSSQWKFYIPTDQKRPEDEYVDFLTLPLKRQVPITEDEGILKMVLEEGSGQLIEATDEVLYKHETRFDTG